MANLLQQLCCCLGIGRGAYPRGQPESWDSDSEDDWGADFSSELKDAEERKAQEASTEFARRLEAVLGPNAPTEDSPTPVPDADSGAPSATDGSGEASAAIAEDSTYEEF